MSDTDLANQRPYRLVTEYATIDGGHRRDGLPVGRRREYLDPCLIVRQQPRAWPPSIEVVGADEETRKWLAGGIPPKVREVIERVQTRASTYGLLCDRDGVLRWEDIERLVQMMQGELTNDGMGWLLVKRE